MHDVSEQVLQAPLDEIEACDRITLCEGVPEDYSDATTLKSEDGAMLGETSVTFTGPSYVDDEDDEMELLTQEIEGLEIDENGFWDHVALVDDDEEIMHAVSSHSSSSIVTVDLDENRITIEDDLTDEIVHGDQVSIRGSESEDNDGVYIVELVELHGSGSDTDLYFSDHKTLTTDSGDLGDCVYAARRVRADDEVYVEPVRWTAKVNITQT